MLDEKTIENKAVLTPQETKQQFHFAGSGIWKPKTVLADTSDEAQKIWETARELVEPVKPDNKIKQ